MLPSMGISIFCCSFLGLRNFKVKGYYLQNPSKIKDFEDFEVYGNVSGAFEIWKAWISIGKLEND